jgi:hypothetical protein
MAIAPKMSYEGNLRVPLRRSKRDGTSFAGMKKSLWSRADFEFAGKPLVKVHLLFARSR